MMQFKQGHAVIIGVGDDLPNTVADAQGLAKIVKNQGRCAYPPGQVVLLTKQDADRDGILTALDALAAATDEDSTVVVYFSGHGYEVSTSFANHYFLLPYGYDLTGLKDTAISGREFVDKLRAIAAKKLLVLLDCCHAGGVGEAKAPGIEALTKAPVPLEALELLRAGRGRVLIASSQEDELSYAGDPYSAFTLALIEALCGTGVAKKDGYVRASDLAMHAREVVPGRTGDRQHPVLHFKEADNFVLAYYAGGAKEPQPLPFDVDAVEIEPEPGAWHVQGDVVEGDKITVFDQRGQQVQTQINVKGVKGDLILQQAAQPGADVAVLRQVYLYRLLRQTRGLPLSGVDRKVADEEGNGEVQLSAVYTALLTQQPERSDFPEMRQASERETRRLSAVEVLNRERYLVLLGEPGSGKTTFVNFVALCLAGEALGDPDVNLAALIEPLPDERPELERDDDEETQPQPWDHPALLPVWVVLRDFVARGLPEPEDLVTGRTLWEFIVGELGHAEYAPHLKRELLERGGLILLDGLDEVPEAKERRVQVKAAVQGFVSDFPNCRFLVTSRTYAYQRQDWKLQGFAEVVLAPFTPGQVARFVERWYAHVGQVRGWDADHTQGQAVVLRGAIERSERLTELAKRPLLLTLMASLHAWRGGSLPEKREELYADAVDLLLEKWEGRKVVRNAAGDLVLQQRSLAEWLKVDRKVVRAELERLAFEAHRDQPGLKSTADIAQERLVSALMGVARNPEARANPVELADYLCERAGLLVDRGDRVYAFPHRTFQEYLAACHLTDHGFPEEIAGLLRADPQRWREATLLAGAKAAGGTSLAVWALAETLCYEDVPAGNAFPEPACWGALLAAQVVLENERERLDKVFPRNVPKVARIQRWLRAILERGWLLPVDRLQAGNALAVLGDERDFDELVEIPAGPFLMGDDDDDRASPRHEVTLPTYKIAKYPVTNVQYQRFVAATGRSWWNTGSRAELANHPAVAMTWHDARAYCAWLTDEWRKVGKIGRDETVRLPSEAEWEKAARGPVLSGAEGEDGRRYPWGKAWDADKCNTSESGLSSTTSVGMYPDGASPYGCLDMAGNVFEWTRSLWGFNLSQPEYKYPYVAKDGREDVASHRVMRVVRGGSFSSRQDLARCAFRGRFVPYTRGARNGFRVVVSRAQPPGGTQ